MPNRRCKEKFKTSKGEADPKRRFLQFDVQEICDNFEKEIMNIHKDISKIHKKSTSTRAPVAEPSLFLFFIKQHFIDSYSPLEEEMFTILNNKAILAKETAITKAEHIEKQR
ncbi:hypothetical protein F2Q68_00021045 [Brassica cretica]|uniref:Uncharacterized protein n=1 Tax=Brassica cretica TaxID=69181 RepID=A0A8S9G306_BRACR|nr:hypothetical protein F2Q68_00021045 [Brassica cretica]